MHVAVFGYGSLVSQAEAELTLRRPAVLLPALLKGWVREWNAVIENPASPPHFILPANGAIPPKVIALNIYKSSATKEIELNGVLFAAGRDELAWLDARESHYMRIDITDEVVTQHPFEKIYTYVAKEEFVSTHADDAVVPSSYVEVVERAFKNLGEDAWQLYERSTLPPRHMLIEAQYIRK